MINGISFFFSANLKESDHFRIINKDIISIISEDIIDHLISLISFNDLINIRVRYFLVQGLATSRYVSQSHWLNTPSKTILLSLIAICPTGRPGFLKYHMSVRKCQSIQKPLGFFLSIR